jgi:hypothetical protein
LQEKLIPLVTSDATRYFEARPSGGLKLKDLTTLPPELRGALSEVVISEKGKISVKLHNKLHAIDSLLKTIPGAIAPRSLDVTGMVQVEAHDGDDISATDRMRRLNGIAWAELTTLAGDADVQRRAAEGLVAAVRFVLGDSGEDAYGEVPEAKAEAALMALCAAPEAIPDDARVAGFLGRVSELRDAIEEGQSTAAATASAQEMVPHNTEAMPGLSQKFDLSRVEPVSVDRMKTVLLAIVNVAKPFHGDCVLAPVFAGQMRKIADAMETQS